MFKISARTRISLAMVGVVTSALIVSRLIGIMPQRSKIVMDARQKLCESLAMSGLTILASSKNTDGFSALLNGAVKRNPDLLSGALRSTDGTIVFQTNDHESIWQLASQSTSNDRYMFVPLYDGTHEWGRMELAFKPLIDFAPYAFMREDMTLLLVFVGAVCFLGFNFFLKRVLSQFDSSAVPKRVRDAFDSLTEGLLIVDPSDRILLANHAFASVLAVDPDKLVGQRASRLGWIDDDDASSAKRPWQRALELEIPLSNQMIRIENSESIVKTFAVNSSPLLGAEGKYRGVMVSFDDVTLLEEKNEQLGLAKAEAEEANRAKSDFLANMSHEIRTPMNAIMGFTDVLRRGLEDNHHKKLEYLNTIHASGTHLLELINDILDLSKIEAGHLDVEFIECSPCRIIADVFNVLRVKADQQGIELRTIFDSKVPESITTDPTRLRQILMNLVGNAIKFTREGHVAIRCAFMELKNGNFIEFAVEDTGIGMSPEQQQKIFNPFEQADKSVTRKFGGTGLGLSISKRFSEALGGKLQVTSQLDRGSVFTVRLEIGETDDISFIDPAGAKQRVTETESVPQDQERINIRPSKILLVDDGETNRQLVALILKRLGLEVDEAENGQIAVDKVEADDFDLVLLDMQMPVMDGYTAAQTLRENGYEIPIIALTGNAMQGEQQKCEDAGCNGFLTKPIDMDKLVEMLIDYLGEEELGDPAPMEPSSRINDTVSTEVDPIDVMSIPFDNSMSSLSNSIPNTSQDAAHSSTITETRIMKTRQPVRTTLPMDDPEFRSIVDRFLDGLPSKLEQLCTHWEQREYDELARLAHWLKGAAGTVGFGDFTAPATHLEQLAIQRCEDQVENAICEILDLVEAISLEPEIN